MQSSVITSQDEMLELLHHASEAGLKSVVRTLNFGDRIQIDATPHYYVIDHPHIFQEIAGMDTDEFPFEAIRDVFPGPTEDRSLDDILQDRIVMCRQEGKEFGDETAYWLEGTPYRFEELPFSKAVERRVGVCFERSVLLQLKLQTLMKSFILIGKYESSKRSDGHAYNAVWRNGQLKLADARISPSKPNMLPFAGIDISDGRIIIPEYNGVYTIDGLSKALSR